MSGWQLRHMEIKNNMQSQSPRRYRNQITHEQEEKYSANDPEQRRIDACDPKMLTRKAVCERDQVFHNGRLDICTLFHCWIAICLCQAGMPRRVRRIIHAACFEHRKQLAGRLKIKAANSSIDIDGCRNPDQRAEPLCRPTASARRKERMIC